MEKGDMLVKLYALDDLPEALAGQKQKGIVYRKPLGGEKQVLVDWVQDTFGTTWIDETKQAFTVFPISCYTALMGNKIVWFSCYDVTALGFFGPIGVDKKYRGQGIGATLLRCFLLDMKSKGYGYAIIGWVGKGARGFYRIVEGDF